MFVVILAVGALLAVGYLQLGVLKRTADILAAEELQLGQARVRLQAMKALAEKEEEFKEQLAVLEQLLPKDAGDERLLVDMQSAADLSALRFTVIRFGERAKTDGVYVLPVNMTFEGRFHGMLNLLEYIRLYERAVRIEEIKAEVNQQAAPDLTAYIKASAFYTGE